MLRRIWRALKGKGAPSVVREMREPASMSEVAALQNVVNADREVRRQVVERLPEESHPLWKFSFDPVSPVAKLEFVPEVSPAHGVPALDPIRYLERGMVPVDIHKKKVALCMIVKNEAAVLRRLIASVAEHIDFYVIEDTGSTDGTIELIRGEMLDRGIPGVIFEEEWKDFGTNRSSLMRHARMAVADRQADYLLLLDADMELVAQGELRELGFGLQADAYMVRIEDEPAYSLPLLVRGGLEWRYEGVTHEALVCDAAGPRVDLEGFAVVHHCDGARRPEKTADDRRLLQGDIARQVFYLAQTERDLGNVEAAASLYERRAEMGGFDEEVFFSLLQAGILRDDVGLLLRAYAERPSRLEPLYEIVTRLRTTGRYEMAFRMLTTAALGSGSWSPVPKDVLFVHEWVWSWGLPFELSIVAYHRGDHWGCWALSEALVEQDRLPELQCGQAVENARLARLAMAEVGDHRLGRPITVARCVEEVLG